MNWWRRFRRRVDQKFRVWSLPPWHQENAPDMPKVTVQGGVGIADSYTVGDRQFVDSEQARRYYESFRRQQPEPRVDPRTRFRWNQERIDRVMRENEEIRKELEEARAKLRPKPPQHRAGFVKKTSPQ